MRDRTIVTAQKVADYFIWLSNQNRTNITNKQVQALLFISQCKHLHIYKKIMFHDRIKTFKEGYVAVPKVNNKLKDKEIFLQYNDKCRPLFELKIQRMLDDVFLRSMEYSENVLMKIITESEIYKKTRKTHDKFFPIMWLKKFFA